MTEKDIRDVELKISSGVKSAGKHYKNKQYIMQVDKEEEELEGDKDKNNNLQDETSKGVEEIKEAEINNVYVQENIISSNKTELSTVDKLLEDLGITWYNIRIYLILTLFFLADGAEMIVISLLISKLGLQWGLSPTKKGLMGSAVFIGFFIGALVSGKLSDTKGRKPTFIIGALIVCLFATLSAFSFDYISLLIFRALNGFGIGMSVPSSTSLATEVTPIKWRAWILNLVWVFFPFGEIFAVVIARTVLDKEDGWRILLGFAAIPSLLAFIISFFIYESPKYYLATKQYDKALNGINRMYKYKHNEDISEEMKKNIIKENEENSKNNIYPNFKTLVKKDYFFLTIKCCVIFFISSFIYYGVVYILPQTMERVALESSSNNDTLSNFTNLNTTVKDLIDPEDNYNMTETEKDKMYKGIILSALSEIPSTFLTGYLANIPALGRIKSMALGLILTVFSSIICGLFLNYLTVTASLLKFSINIPFNVIYIYVTEAFPTKIRSIANGVTNSCNRLGGITTPIFSQFAFSISNAMPYYLYAFAAFIGVIITFTLPFETLGKDIN